jgi:hypothetical protein
MDDHGSFKNFDRGWILPTGSRRHNRAIPEPSLSSDAQPPRNRPRTGKIIMTILAFVNCGHLLERAKSRLSIVTDGTYPDALGKDPGPDIGLISPQDCVEVDHSNFKSRNSSSQQRISLDGESYSISSSILNFSKFLLQRI